MREKSIDNYYLHIEPFAIDVYQNDGTSYIKVVDKESTMKRAVFTMDLRLVSSTVDIEEIDKIEKILSRNLSLLREREMELM